MMMAAQIKMRYRPAAAAGGGASHVSLNGQSVGGKSSGGCC